MKYTALIPYWNYTDRTDMCKNNPILRQGIQWIGIKGVFIAGYIDEGRREVSIMFQIANIEYLFGKK